MEANKGQPVATVRAVEGGAAGDHRNSVAGAGLTCRDAYAGHMARSTSGAVNAGKGRGRPGRRFEATGYSRDAEVTQLGLADLPVWRKDIFAGLMSQSGLPTAIAVWIATAARPIRSACRRTTDRCRHPANSCG